VTLRPTLLGCARLEEFLGYGIELRPALKLRDQLVRMAKESDAQSGKLSFEGGEASLVINIVGVPSFQIDTTN
jgi:hypothetical protein